MRFDATATGVSEGFARGVADGFGEGVATATATGVAVAFGVATATGVGVGVATTATGVGVAFGVATATAVGAGVAFARGVTTGSGETSERKYGVSFGLALATICCGASKPSASLSCLRASASRPGAFEAIFVERTFAGLMRCARRPSTP